MSLLDTLRRLRGSGAPQPVPVDQAKPRAAMPNLLSRLKVLAPPQEKQFVPSYIKNLIAEDLLYQEEEKLRASPSSPITKEEWNRIFDLGLRAEVTPELIDQYSNELIDGRAYLSGQRLLPNQVAGLKEYRDTNGLLGQIRVGAGKTLLSLLIASEGVKRHGFKRILLLIPSSVSKQLNRELPQYRAWMPLACRFLNLTGVSLESRVSMVQSVPKHEPMCFVLPYSLLSLKDTRDLLEAINPELVISDEADALARPTAARTKRFNDFMGDRPEVHYCCMSGTLTTKSMMNYYHLARLALKQRAPMPLQKNQALDWGGVIDSNTDASLDRSRAALGPLMRWVNRTFADQPPLPETSDGFSEAYRTRLGTAPGCVMTTGQEDIGVELAFRFTHLDPPGPQLLEHLKLLDEAWISPVGDEIAYALHLYKWRYELSAGFYYALEWPDPEKQEDVDVEAVDRAKQHHAALQSYNRGLRIFLGATSIPGLDTPLLVGSALAHPQRRKLVPSDLARGWDHARSLEFIGMPERIQRPVRVDSYKIDAAVEWCRALGPKEGAILWVLHKEMGDWLMECIAADSELGPRLLSARAGESAIELTSNASRICVASLGSQGRGKNLQHFGRQLFVQWPRPAKDAEQTIGRTHRRGQKTRQLIVECLLGIPFDSQNVSATMIDALYNELTTGNEQKILHGKYIEPPHIYEPRLLRKLGFGNKDLDSSQARSLRDRIAGK